MTEGVGARPRVIYLGGFGRSGSTLLERMLGAVPGWVNVGELVDLPRSVLPDDERCGCGERFSSCAFWSEVGRRAYAGWDADRLRRLADLRTEVARQRQVPMLLRAGRTGGRRLTEALGDYQQDYGRLYRAVAEVSGASYVVDASKGPAQGLALGVRGPGLADPGFDLSFVNLVRDPRGVAYSWSRRRHARPQAGADGGARATMWSPGVARSAAEWAALQSEMALIGRVSGIPMVRVRYEDLMAEPRAAMASMLTTLGARAAAGDLAHVGDHDVTLTASHGLSGNPGRFEHGTLDLRPDDEWRRALPAGERRLVTAATLPWLQAYGYLRASASPTTAPTQG